MIKHTHHTAGNTPTHVSAFGQYGMSRQFDDIQEFIRGNEHGASLEAIDVLTVSGELKADTAAAHGSISSDLLHRNAGC
jgi:hypothetical protein